jgi:hypothetical protein
MRSLALVVVLGAGLLGLGAEMGAGFSGVGILMWDISALNTALEDAGYPVLEGPLFLYGGTGLGGEDLRFGGGGFGGQLSAEEGSRSSTLGVGFGGFVVEIPVMEGNGFAAIVGFLGGGGGAELLLRSRAYSSLEDALSGPADLHISRSFWAFLPYVAAEFWPVEWFGIRVMLGNLITITQKWTAGAAEFGGPPDTFGGPFFCFELAFGGRAPETSGE